MPLYQKAYLLKQLRRFSGWTERRLEDRKRASHGEEAKSPEPDELTDESIVYLQEDLRVFKSCFDASQIIFDSVTPEWEKFCREELHFAVPDWEEESRIVREKLAKMGPET